MMTKEDFISILEQEGFEILGRHSDNYYYKELDYYTSVTLKLGEEDFTIELASKEYQIASNERYDELEVGVDCINGKYFSIVLE